MASDDEPRKPRAPRGPGGKGPRKPSGDGPARRGDRPGGERPKKPFRPRAEGSRSEGDRKPYRPREDAGRAERKPFRPRPEGSRPEGDRKPYRQRSEDAGSGERKPFRPRPEGSRPDGDRKPYRPREDAGSGERKPYRQRSEDAGTGERKPFRPRPEGDRKPFRPRPEGSRPEGDRKPYRQRSEDAGSGERKPFRPRPEGERKPYRPREDAGTGERKPYRPREEGGGTGERKPFRPRPDGDRKPFRPREEGDTGERKPFRPRPEGDRKPYRPREEGDTRERKPFRPRAEGGHPEGDRKPYRPRPEPRVLEPVVGSETTGPDMGGERIAKHLARAGIASRRDAEAMIAEGRVSLNGAVLDSPAITVGPGDVITVDGKAIPAIERTRLFLYHKPAGLVTTNRDPEGRPTVFERLPADLPRLVTVGRLDINTEGLLLLTNDGGLARILELPKTGWLRRYRVRVHGTVDEDALATLRQGIAVDGVLYGAIEVELDRVQGANAWLTVGLREGKNREVKTVLGAFGLDVTRLIRVSFGPFQLGDLGEGEVRELRGRYLRDQLGERLIAESGALFDAPLHAVEAEAHPEAPRQKPARRPRPSEDERREEARGRLTTRRGEGGADGLFRRGEKPARRTDSSAPAAARPKREEPERHTRSANVWRAPGARPDARDLPVKPKPEGDKPAGGPGGRKGGRGADRRR